ncbi:MAG: GIY-YIG nuclease family protein [bacterium]
MWFVYILECENKAFYTGVTNNIERRYKEHLNKKAHYTSYNPPVRLAYKETYQTRSEALKREAQIKGWTRKKKIALINGDLILLKQL